MASFRTIGIGWECWNNTILEWWGILSGGNWVCLYNVPRLCPAGPAPPGAAGKLALFGATRLSVSSAGDSAAYTRSGPRRQIGFVLPKSVACMIYHNSFFAKYLPLPSLGRKLALFRTIARRRGLATARAHSWAPGANWVRFARTAVAEFEV